MANRPNVPRPNWFQLEHVETVLRKKGLPDHSVSPTISAMRLVIPAVISNIGEDRILAIMDRMDREWGFANTRWKQMVPYIVEWATAELDEYKAKLHST